MYKVYLKVEYRDKVYNSNTDIVKEEELEEYVIKTSEEVRSMVKNAQNPDVGAILTIEAGKGKTFFPENIIKESIITMVVEEIEGLKEYQFD